jgi:Coenzyme PQQ synthesis protein D (PqqD)
MYKVSEDIRSTHGRDGAVVLDIRQGQMFNLNVVGARMLQLLSAGRAENEIIAEISGEFSVSTGAVETDLVQFIQALTRYHLLEISDSVDDLSTTT